MFIRKSIRQAGSKNVFDLRLGTGGAKVFLATEGSKLFFAKYSLVILAGEAKNAENIILLQLNKYETDPYFLQNFQSNTTVCLIIHAFCKVCEREIVFVLICRTARTILGSRLLTVRKFQKQIVKP